MSSRPQTVTPLAWAAVAICWVVQLSVPWTSSGPLSRSTLADALTLVRGGGVDAAVPSSTAAGALVLPICGVLLALLAGVRGRVARAGRLLVALAGTVAVVVALRVLPQDDAGLGAGGRWAFAGCVLVFVAAGLEVVGWLREAGARGRRPTAPGVRRLAAGVTVAGLVLGVVLGGQVGWQATRHQGGAASPEAAARDLVEALVARDAAAVLGVTAPDEVPGVVDTFLRLRDRLAADGGDDGADGDGGTSVTDVVTLDLAEPDVDVEPDGADRARVALVGGAYELRVDLDALPGAFGVLEPLFPDGRLTGDLGDLADSPLALFLPEGAERITVTTARVDGRWYVAGLGAAVERIGGVLLGDGVPDVADLPGVLLDRLRPDDD